MLRNRRTIIFTLVFPAGAVPRLRPAARAGTTTVGHGNVAAYIMVSMALYGAALTAAVGRRHGRHGAGPRLVAPAAADPAAARSSTSSMKALVALVMGAVAIAVVNVAGIVQGKPEMPAERLGRVRACSPSLCTLVFAALGVFVGYLVPGENAMQILGPGLALLVVPRRRVHPARRQHQHCLRTSPSGRRCTASPRSPARR